MTCAPSETQISLGISLCALVRQTANKDWVDTSTQADRSRWWAYRSFRCFLVSWPNYLNGRLRRMQCSHRLSLSSLSVWEYGTVRLRFHVCELFIRWTLVVRMKCRTEKQCFHDTDIYTFFLLFFLFLFFTCGKQNYTCWKQNRVSKFILLFCFALILHWKMQNWLSWVENALFWKSRLT